MRMMPMMVALDADGDGQISAEEIEKSAARLKTLDKNQDGKLTEEELRPNFEGREGRGPGGPGGGEAMGPELVARLMEQDKNGDGKLSKDELPERMQRILERADTNRDGFATLDELNKMANDSAGRGGEGRGGEGRGRPEGRGEGRMGEGGRGGMGMFGNPVAFVERLFELDADKDGKLSRDELAKIADVLRPAEGGRPEGRPEGRPNR